MKKSLLFLFISLTIQGFAQRNLEPEIFLINKDRMHYVSVRKGMEIGYARLGDARYLTGRVDSIRSDILYINGDGVPVRSMQIITNPVFSDQHPDPVKYRGSGVLYRSDTVSWDVYVPTSHDLLSKGTRDLAISDYIRELKREKGILLKKPKHNTLFINLSRIAALDFAVTYEYAFSDLVTLSAEVGYKVSPGKGPNLGEVIYPYAQSGPSLLIGPKFVFRDKFYFASLLHLKYLEVNNKYYNDLFSDMAAAKMDRRETDIGLSIRTGVMLRTGSLAFDFYAGGGIKYIVGHETDYEYYSPSGMIIDDSPQEKELYLWRPIINLGIKIGFGF